MTLNGMTPPAPSIHAVVFDLDGVIANTEDLYEKACETVLGRRGKTYDAPLREQMMGRPVADSIRIMLDAHALPDPLEDVIKECWEDLQKLMQTSLAPMPGVVDLIDRLRSAELPIAVATSALRDYADFVLTRLDLKRRFRFILTAEDVRAGKPAPDIYQMAARKLAIMPKEMMVLEDSANGCRAGVAAGAFVVAVPNRHTRSHDFTGTKLIANTLADPRILEALPMSHA